MVLITLPWITHRPTPFGTVSSYQCKQGCHRLDLTRPRTFGAEVHLLVAENSHVFLREIPVNPGTLGFPFC